ncbi:glycosyl transferase family 1 [Homoserinimonas aerilata]|uniref:D-inositol 3-phosphate glycosyltransferase n=1 Tax=Homoserinimonas aerilata TaxID=1162970 RepID=A0A542YKL0_9MICO|nr:glycosyltransferase [Homoserinimonas aerilata]TQL48625.1 glycosyl transferase family 1 [Homoserinimonas aerilata]
MSGPDSHLENSDDSEDSPTLTEPWWHAPLRRSDGLSRRWLASTALTAVAICTAFVIVFKFQIAPTFSYGGIVYREPNYIFLGLSFALVWALLLILGPGSLRGSRILTAILVYLLGIPALIIPNIIDIEDRTTSFGLVFFFFCCFAAIILGVRVIPRFNLPKIRTPEWSIVGLLLVFTVATFSLLQYYVGVSWWANSVTDIYDDRAGYSEMIRNAPEYMGYLIAIQTKVIGPVLLLIGLASRRWRPLIAIAVLSQYLIFATTLAKQSLFSIFAIVAAYLIFRLVRNADQRVIAFVVLLMTIATSVIDWARGRVYFTEIVIDRFFFWPGFLPMQYHKTFESRPFNFWSDSVLQGFVPDQSPGEVAELLVGHGLTGNDGVFANASFLGNGYANMGLAGILVEAAVLVAILYGVGLAAQRFPLWVTAPLMVMPAVALSNGSPFTAILSGGILPLIVLMWLSPTELLAGDDYRKKPGPSGGSERSRKRITIVTGYFDEFSGYYEVSLARELSKHFDVTVVTGNRVAPIFDTETLRLLDQDSYYRVGRSGTQELAIIRLPYIKFGSLLLPRGLIRTLRAETSQAVFIMGVGQGFSMPAALFSRLGVRVSIFGDNRAQWAGVPAAVRPLKWVAFSLTKGVMYWLVMQRSNLLYGVTPNTLTRLEPFSTGSEMRLLPLPVDPEVFRYNRTSRTRVRDRYDLSGMVIGVVGKVSREKQIERVIEGFAEIAERRPASRLVIAGLGTDTYSQDLRKRVEDDPVLSKRVVLLGFLKSAELSELLSGIDVCVWPVQPAITIQQSLVMGCRVVVPDNDLVGFLANRGEFGTTFAPDDWSALSAAMAEEADHAPNDRERETRITRTQTLTTPVVIRELVRDIDKTVAGERELR